MASRAARRDRRPRPTGSTSPRSPSTRRRLRRSGARRKLDGGRVLLTNDDGIDAEGLQRLRRELLATPGVDLAVVAPDGNRSAVGRGITTRRALAVERIAFGDGTFGYATDGTPVDCVRLASLGLVEGWL